MLPKIYKRSKTDNDTIKAWKFFWMVCLENEEKKYHIFYLWLPDMRLSTLFYLDRNEDLLGKYHYGWYISEYAYYAYDK